MTWLRHCKEIVTHWVNGYDLSVESDSTGYMQIGWDQLTLCKCIRILIFYQNWSLSQNVGFIKTGLESECWFNQNWSLSQNVGFIKTGPWVRILVLSKLVPESECWFYLVPEFDQNWSLSQNVGFIKTGPWVRMLVLSKLVLSQNVGFIKTGPESEFWFYQNWSLSQNVGFIKTGPESECWFYQNWSRVRMLILSKLVPSQNGDFIESALKWKSSEE